METSTQVMGNGEIRLTPGSAAKFAREVRAKTRCQFSAEDEIGIVLEGLRNEIPVSDLGQREEISSAFVLFLAQGLYGGRESPPKAEYSTL